MTKEEYDNLKYSNLIELALKDLKVVEKMKGYIIDMSSYHMYDEVDDVCEVCLGGVTLVHTLNVDRKVFSFNDEKSLNKFGINTAKQLRKLNYARLGFKKFSEGHKIDDLFTSKEWIMMDKIEKALKKGYTAYEKQPTVFKTWLKHAAHLLRQEGV